MFGEQTSGSKIISIIGEFMTIPTVSEAHC
jgi:hypothetical protein